MSRSTLASFVLASATCVSTVHAQTTARAVLDASGAETDLGTTEGSLSDDGRFLAFNSVSGDIVLGDANGKSDVFVRDLQTGSNQRVSVDSSLAEGNDHSFGAWMAGNGRFVAFASDATNLVGGDTNGARDAFVRDLQAGLTSRVSVATGGTQSNGSTQSVSISSDGRYVAFASSASNLVVGDTNTFFDVFVHDRQALTTVRVSVSSNGVQGNFFSEIGEISADGRFVAFASRAANLVVGDTNGVYDVFVHDLQTATTVRASVDSAGAQADATSYAHAISADGRWLAFGSGASNLVAGDTNAAADVFVRDLVANTTTRVSVDSAGLKADGSSGFTPTEIDVSSDGRFVAFVSMATNLVERDTNGVDDVFVRDLQSGLTTRASVDSAGNEGDDASWGPTLSGDRALVVFTSQATALVPGDTNLFADLFVHDPTPLACAQVAHYCQSKASSQACLPALSTNGSCSASAGSGFTIDAAQIVPNKTGLFFYSTTGATSAPFQGGKLCAKAPIERTTPQGSGGSAACSGTYAIDFNAYIASAVDPALVAGAQFWGQYWYRDPQSASTTGLTHAMTTLICP